MIVAILQKVLYTQGSPHQQWLPTGGTSLGQLWAFWAWSLGLGFRAMGSRVHLGVNIHMYMEGLRGLGVE